MLSPNNSSAIFSFTFLTAFVVPFPKYLVLSPSLNSKASNFPVEAPDGTIAVPTAPLLLRLLGYLLSLKLLLHEFQLFHRNILPLSNTSIFCVLI